MAFNPMVQHWYSVSEGRSMINTNSLKPLTAKSLTLVLTFDVAPRRLGITALATLSPFPLIPFSPISSNRRNSHFLIGLSWFNSLSVLLPAIYFT